MEVCAHLRLNPWVDFSCRQRPHSIHPVSRQGQSSPERLKANSQLGCAQKRDVCLGATCICVLTLGYTGVSSFVRCSQLESKCHVNEVIYSLALLALENLFKVGKQFLKRVTLAVSSGGTLWGFPDGSGLGKESGLQGKRPRFHPSGVGRSSGDGNGAAHSRVLARELHGQGAWVGHSPWGHKDSGGTYKS